MFLTFGWGGFPSQWRYWFPKGFNSTLPVSFLWLCTLKSCSDEYFWWHGWYGVSGKDPILVNICLPRNKSPLLCIINFVWAFCEKLCLGSNMLKLISYKTIFCIMAHVWTGYFHLGLISMKETSTQHTMDPLVVRGKCPWMVLPSSIHTSDWKCRFLLKKTSISSLLKRFKKKVFFSETS